MNALQWTTKRIGRLSTVVVAVLVFSTTIEAFSSSFVQRSAQMKAFSSIRPPQTTLSMHMGHSHNHDHASSSSLSQQESKTASSFTTRILRFATRRVARISFAGAAVAGAVCFQRRRVRPSDIGLFLVTALSLSVLDKIKQQVKDWNVRFQEFTKTLEKHATPLFSGDEEERQARELHRAADQVTYLGVAINLVLSVGKAVTGVMCHSTALVADAGHSLSDLFSDFITLYAVQLGRLPPDDDHPYGHGKFEAVGSLFLALTLLATGVSVGAASAHKLSEILTLSSTTAVPAILPKRPALIMAAISIVSKEWLYRITKRVGEALNSQVVIANAWHHRSDAYSSILALFSIALAMNGWVAADAGAGLVVAGMIAMTGVEIMGESIKQLTDTVDESLVQRVEMVLHQAKHHYGNRVITSVQRVRARQVGSSSLVDVAIVAPQNVTNPRALEDELRSKIMKQLPCVIDAEVRVVPKDDDDEDHTVLPQNAASPSVVEQEVRGEIRRHASVVSIGEVRVGDSGNVDVTIRVNPLSTVQEANGLALQLIDSLQRHDSIESARIYLDLNEHMSIPIVNTSK